MPFASGLCHCSFVLVGQLRAGMCATYQQRWQKCCQNPLSALIYWKELYYFGFALETPTSISDFSAAFILFLDSFSCPFFPICTSKASKLTDLFPGWWCLLQPGSDDEDDDDFWGMSDDDSSSSSDEEGPPKSMNQLTADYFRKRE